MKRKSAASPNAQVVSDDREFRREIERIFDSLDRPCAVSDVETWRESGGSATGVAVRLLDLRDAHVGSERLWSALDDSTAADGAARRPLTIGLFSDAIPLEHAKASERYLDETISGLPSSQAAVALTRMLERSPAQPRRGDAATECRVLRTANYEFRTYSPALFTTLDQLETAARHDFTILIVGETGTGKTTLAAMIHELSSRRKSRLLTVACGALPGDLIDSELFGHVKGAFTGADRAKDGKFEASEDGTILLDEIDVLGLVQQTKLLRVLETRQFEPVGSNDTKTARCRTIVASNVDLESLIAERRFRADLYFRLNQVKFVIPPLRERPLDIVPLAVDFITACCREHGIKVTRVHPDFLNLLKSYSWPGNIRQLRNEVRRAVLFSRDGIISPDALSLELLKDAVERTWEPAPERSALAQRVALTERQTIERMLHDQNNNRAATARALGISRVTLYNKLKKFRMMPDASTAKQDEQ
ncbi:MAG: sigma-54 dependent transcriptional regulator [Planctomycetota bacterium]